MKPGRELNVLVAEKVMGKKLETYVSDYELLHITGAFNGTYEEFFELQDVWSPPLNLLG